MVQRRIRVPPTALEDCKNPLTCANKFLAAPFDVGIKCGSLNCKPTHSSMPAVASILPSCRVIQEAYLTKMELWKIPYLKGGVWLTDTFIAVGGKQFSWRDRAPRKHRSTPTTVIIRPNEKRSTRNIWLTLYYERER